MTYQIPFPWVPKLLPLIRAGHHRDTSRHTESMHFGTCGRIFYVILLSREEPSILKVFPFGLLISTLLQSFISFLNYGQISFLCFILILAIIWNEFIKDCWTKVNSLKKTFFFLSFILISFVFYLNQNEIDRKRKSFLLKELNVS